MKNLRRYLQRLRRRLNRWLARQRREIALINEQSMEMERQRGW